MTPSRAPEASSIDPRNAARAQAVTLELRLQPEQLRELAEQLAPLVAERQAPAVSMAEWLDTQAAEAYAGMKPGRLDDLKRLGKVEPAGYDGRKPMYRRGDLDAYLGAAR